MNTDIVFIQQLPMPYFGVLAMDAHLKKSGHRTAVVIDSLEKNFINVVSRLNPKVIGLSVFSSEHIWLMRTSARLRAAFPGIIIIAGGVHAMIYPDTILADTPVDLVCYGDGEEAISGVLAQAQRPQADWSLVAGIAYRNGDGGINTTVPAPPAAYRKDIIEDRKLYFDSYPVLAGDKIGLFLSSRGCPYACSFCYNAYLRYLSSDKKKYLRQKDPDNFIREISLQTSGGAIKTIYFVDDMFTFDPQWLRSFLKRYRTEIGLPFACNTRANQVNEEIAEILSHGGCRFASFGIETGNQNLRWSILEKEITNEEIIHAGNILHKYGIGVRTSNMFCLPGETVQDAFDTVELNIKIRADSASSTLLLPYPKTKIFEHCRKQGLLQKSYTLYDIPHVTQRTSILDIPNKRKIINTHYLLYWFVRFPWSYKIGKHLIYAEWLNGILHLFYLAGYFLRNKNENGLGWLGSFVYAWRKRHLMFPKESPGEENYDYSIEA